MDYDIEEQYDKNYPRKFVTDIPMETKDWIELLTRKETKTFRDSDIQFLKRIYTYPHHAATCLYLAESEGKSPQAYNKPVVSLARRIQKYKQLPPIYGVDGKETFWRVLFWGRNLPNGLFEWKIRPELAVAMKQLWPELDVENINKQEDARYVEDVSNSNLQKLPEFKEYIGKPRPTPEKISVSGTLVYPRDRKVAINALAKSGCTCEYNKAHESFISKFSNRRYLEQHHLIPLMYADDFDYSIDIEENVVSLCSNCHNEIHYGINAEKIIKKLYNERKDSLEKAGICISLDWLLEKYK